MVGFWLIEVWIPAYMLYGCFSCREGKIIPACSIGYHYSGTVEGVGGELDLKGERKRNGSVGSYHKRDGRVRSSVEGV